MQVQVGIRRASSGQPVALAGVRFGRIDAPTLAALSSLLSSEPSVTLRVTPWRAFAFACHSTAQADVVLRGVGKLGLLIDAHDPSLGVVTCIGARGCWETELDTLAEAERFVATRRADFSPSSIVHVSGCDKRCATRGTVALTLLGRADQTGFDEVWPTSE
jgi:precorrin-3B synthase